jgi:hypothetical protein
VTGQTQRLLVNIFLAVFLAVLAIDVFLPKSESGEGLKDRVNTALVVTGLWQGPWRLYGPEVDKVNLRFKAEVVFADQAVATWTSPDWSQVSALRKYALARHMNYYSYLLRAGEPAFDALCAYVARTVPHPQGKAVAVAGVKLSLRGALIPPPTEKQVPARPYLEFDDWQVIRVWRPPA